MNFEISVDYYFSIISHVVIESLKRSGCLNFEISVDDYFSIISHVVIESLKRSCIDSFKGCCSSPFSVIMLVIKLGGVISNAGLNMCTPLGTILLPAIFVTSFESRSSITTSSIRLLRSNDDRGAAT